MASLPPELRRALFYDSKGGLILREGIQEVLLGFLRSLPLGPAGLGADAEQLTDRIMHQISVAKFNEIHRRIARSVVPEIRERWEEKQIDLVADAVLQVLESVHADTQQKLDDLSDKFFSCAIEPEEWEDRKTTFRLRSQNLHRVLHILLES